MHNYVIAKGQCVAACWCAWRMWHSAARNEHELHDGRHLYRGRRAMARHATLFRSARYTNDFVATVDEPLEKYTPTI